MTKAQKFLKSLSDDKVYYADKTHVTCSMLKYLLKSPAHLQMYLDNPPKSTPAMTFGSAFHCMVLENDKFNDRFYILDTNLRPDKDKGMTSKLNKAWKAEEIKFAKDNDKEMVTYEDLEKIEAMSNSMLKHPEVVNIINTCQKEQAFTWPINKMHCKDIIDAKGKIDLKSFDFIADIKTTAEYGGIDKFKYDCKKYHYDMQAAFYCDALGLDQFKFIVVGKDYPHSVGVFDVSEEFLAAGRSKYLYALDLYEKYFLSCDDQISDYMDTGVL